MKKHTLAVALPVAAVIVASASTSGAEAQPGSQPIQTIPVQPGRPAQQPVQSTTTTTAARYVPYAPTGQRYESTREKLPNRALLSTGTGMFVMSYGASVVAAAVSDREADKPLFIPVVGPWLDLGQRDCDTRPCGSREDRYRTMIVASGIVQSLGVLVALGSLVIPEPISTRTTVSSAAAQKPIVRVTPMSYGAGAGIGAIGRF